MHQLDKVFQHIDANLDRYLDELFTLLRQSSISAQKEGLTQSAGLVCDLLRRSYCTDTQVLWGGDNPCAFGRAPGPAGRPVLLIYGHHDVQPVEPLSEWVSPPFEPTVRDGRIYARGAGDNKGQFAAHLFALQSLKAVLGEIPLTVKFILDGQEESGSPHLPIVVEKYKDLLAADLMCWADGPYHESGRPIIYCGVRGILALEFRARTGSRALHSGNWGGVAANAALKLVHLLAKLKGPDGHIHIPGFYDRVRPITDLDRQALAAIPYDREQLMAEGGLLEIDAPIDRSPYEKIMCWPTFNISGFSAGYTGSGFATRIPAEAVAKVDIRLVADQDPDEVFAGLMEFVRREAPGVDVQRLGTYYPHRTNLSTPYLPVVAQAIRHVWAAEPIIYPAGGGSAPDSLFARTLGVPTMLIPYANTDEANHGPNENIRLDCFVRGIKTSAAILYHLAQMRG